MLLHVSFSNSFDRKVAHFSSSFPVLSVRLSVFCYQEDMIQCTDPDSLQVNTKDMDSTLSKASRAIKKTSKKVKAEEGGRLSFSRVDHCVMHTVRSRVMLTVRPTSPQRRALPTTCHDFSFSFTFFSDVHHKKMYSVYT